MSEAKHPKVTDKEGRIATVSGQIADPSRLLVQLDDGRKLLVPRLALVSEPDGNFRVPFSFSGLEEVSGEYLRRDDSLVIPVIQEETRIDRKLVDTAIVTVRKEIEEREEVISDEVTVEEIAVERIARNELVETAPGIRYEGDLIVVPLVEEVLVVEKKLLLREELYLRRVRRTEPVEKTVLLRSEQVKIEREELPFAREK